MVAPVPIFIFHNYPKEILKITVPVQIFLNLKSHNDWKVASCVASWREKCHFQRCGRYFGPKFSCAPRQPMVARSAESLSVGFFPSEKFLATLLLIGGIIMHLVSYDFSPRQSEDFSVCSHPRNTCSRHCIQAHFPMVSLLFK